MILGYNTKFCGMSVCELMRAVCTTLTASRALIVFLCMLFTSLPVEHVHPLELFA